MKAGDLLGDNTEPGNPWISSRICSL